MIQVYEGDGEDRDGDARRLALDAVRCEFAGRQRMQLDSNEAGAVSRLESDPSLGNIAMVVRCAHIMSLHVKSSAWDECDRRIQRGEDGLTSIRPQRLLDLQLMRRVLERWPTVTEAHAQKWPGL